MTARTTGDKSVPPPWLRILPATERRAFLAEYAGADPTERERLLWEWQRTAAVYADPAVGATAASPCRHLTSRARSSGLTALVSSLS